MANGPNIFQMLLVLYYLRYYTLHDTSVLTVLVCILWVASLQIAPSHLLSFCLFSSCHVPAKVKGAEIAGHDIDGFSNEGLESGGPILPILQTTSRLTLACK